MFRLYFMANFIIFVRAKTLRTCKNFLVGNVDKVFGTLPEIPFRCLDVHIHKQYSLTEADFSKIPRLRYGTSQNSNSSQIHISLECEGLSGLNFFGRNYLSTLRTKNSSSLQIEVRYLQNPSSYHLAPNRRKLTKGMLLEHRC